ncbi:phosphoribosylaminoimidazolesuccinocarboxamide synthase [Amycolatopsis regifaucium]|uniref:Phosphoribosylaminoimidazole-succinocarboxamide synthase n=1 Tax=Amycolatopsis regifaucium TaxID=546365 RepID=A0A154MLB5_9PSEU|nr:phosphoribosylaminoimidazolesuccinocarboxamide synthase [Amycolatopsis regifaucium]KZB85148.1 phosphoribosylaminoimidazolesuccinocarboxamide synthase [Amycolatopsis regifaucium]OKA04173.1 phosphoribosylaminoimidazolesuccinocarboxamide synthase [Amycolatopsis regifaucium]SFH92306.1 phosphoribosylaminoimidazole-succinocarboxamide synthase [Amycolatopsis regifaucium]
MTTLEYPKIAAGKVRELYAVDDEHLLLVTSDRISAYDVIFNTPIPDKGRVLTAMSVFWFSQLSDVLPNHLVSYDDERIPAEVRGRALLVRRLAMLPVEAVARGYLTGTGLADYRAHGSVCGVELPPGLTESSRLPEPIFTPATKADHGSHDENITFSDVVGQFGRKRAEEVREATLAVYRRGAEFAAERGILLADTKLEFGVDREGNLVLADEVLTPDSSRYWPAGGWAPGSPRPSFDKQPLRDWLTGPASGWHRKNRPEPPPLPAEIVAATRARYIDAYERITGCSLDDWPA